MKKRYELHAPTVLIQISINMRVGDVQSSPYAVSPTVESLLHTECAVYLVYLGNQAQRYLVTTGTQGMPCVMMTQRRENTFISGGETTYCIQLNLEIKCTFTLV